MNIKHLILVSLLLAILTIGAVSASEDAALDELAADNEIGGGKLPPRTMEVQSLKVMMRVTT